MEIDLEEKTVLVTGSTVGIGLASGKGLAASGARAVLNGRTQHGIDAHLPARVTGSWQSSQHYRVAEVDFDAPPRRL